MKPIEVNTTIEQEDVKKMMVTAMFFRGPLMLPLLLLVTFAFSYASWSYNKMTSLASLFILWVGFLLVLLFVLIRKALAKSRGGGGMDFVGKEQSYLFSEDSFAYRPGPGRKFTKISYEQLRYYSSVGDFLILYLGKSSALALRKKDLSGDQLQEIITLLRNKGAK